MKTEIGQINLQLPPGFAVRAQRIGRLVGEALSQQGGVPAGRIECIGVGPVRVDHRQSDRAIAATIAASISRAVSQRQGS